MNKLLVKKILESATSYKWQLQGFGMFRLYLSRETRLHVWDSRFRVADVSDIHDHPWHFVSTVIAGDLQNVQYSEEDGDVPFNCQTIKCGPGACSVEVSKVVMLKAYAGLGNRYREGATYRQNATDIHESRSADGTVIVIERTFKSDTEHARSFWPVGKQWVSAEPRVATADEVQKMSELALGWWFT